MPSGINDNALGPPSSFFPLLEPVSSRDSHHLLCCCLAMPTRAEKERRLWAEAAARPPTATERDALYKSSRLGLPLFLRVPLAFASSFAVGFTLGTIQGGRMTGLRFRAEHAHKLPASPAGWFLYHKSKNYHVTLGGLKEGLKMGAKISLLGTAMFGIEAMFDEYRGAKDVFNTVIAAVTVSGCLSFWSTETLACSALGHTRRARRLVANTDVLLARRLLFGRGCPHLPMGPHRRSGVRRRAGPGLCLQRPTDRVRRVSKTANGETSSTASGIGIGGRETHLVGMATSQLPTIPHESRLGFPSHS